MESNRVPVVHEAFLVGEEVLVLILPETSFSYSAAFSILTITPSSEVQIMQTWTLNCRARRDLQLWYSNFLHLTSLRSPNWARKVLLSWNPRISRDLIVAWIGLLINLLCLHNLLPQASLSLRNLLHNGLGPSFGLVALIHQRVAFSIIAIILQLFANFLQYLIMSKNKEHSRKRGYLLAK
ncbi:hypothetical protein U9M48_042586 [Paspalum notatum var. saurae]|uniref:Uncharacterized protein n=1 Tax=Paspalum notatum var. saurae TaxID=547442 RepID=A0AAQ3UR53_PASNO